MVHPETKLFYGAEDHRFPGDCSLRGSDGRREKNSDEKAEKRYFPWFKPDWSTDTLLGFFYFGSYLAVDLAWAKGTKLSGYADGKQNLYDFTFRLLKPYFEIQKQGNLNKDRKMQDIPAFSKRENDDLTMDDTFCEKGGLTSENIINLYALENEEDAGKTLSPEGIFDSDIVCTDLILYHQSSERAPEMIPDGEYFLHTGEMNTGADHEFWGYEKKYAEIKKDFLNNICYGKKEGEKEQTIKYQAFFYQTLHPEVWSVVPDIAVKAENMDGILVSVVIPSKDHPELLKKCIGSFLERTSLTGLQGVVEFIIVDNGSNEKKRQTIQAFLESVEVECHYIYHPMSFNFSAMCNLGAVNLLNQRM